MLKLSHKYHEFSRIYDASVGWCIEIRFKDQIRDPWNTILFYKDKRNIMRVSGKINSPKRIKT